MSRKEDRLEALEAKIEQLKARKQELQQKIRTKERKERTKRLIEVGAIFEKYFDIEGPDQAEQVAKQFADFIKANKIIRLDNSNEMREEKGEVLG